ELREDHVARRLPLAGSRSKFSNLALAYPPDKYGIQCPAAYPTPPPIVMISFSRPEQTDRFRPQNSDRAAVSSLSRKAEFQPPSTPSTMAPNWCWIPKCAPIIDELVSKS